MIPLVLIGIAAGLASALLVAGVAAGSVLAVPLFYMAPLPLMISGLAFSHISAAVGVIIASIVLGSMYGGTFLIAFVLGIGLPAWALSYCALLGRADPAARDGVTWFPVGGLMVVGVGFTTLSVAVGLFSLADTYEAYRDAVVAAFEMFMKARGATEGAGPGSANVFGETIAIILPPTAASLLFATQMGCLYLAGRAARLSGRLARPWPDLPAIRMPAMVPVALAVLVGISMTGGLLGLSASAGAAALVVCYTAVGFAVMHFVTRGRPARPFILAGAWVLTLAIGWPALVMALVGVADALFDLRRRVGTGEPPAANDR
ncbi:DUF2232 domain-containing protein [Xanthobacteraceae bacterium A53D]